MSKFLIYFLLCPVLLFSQDWDAQKLDMITALAQYRTSILSQNAETALALRDIEQSWISSGASSKERKDVFLKIQIAKNIYDRNPAYILKRLRKESPDSDLIRLLTEQDIKVIANNSELADLIWESVLEMTYPYKLDPASYVFNELKFYQLQTGDHIGEIGAGSGTFSFILSIINRDYHLTVNELNGDYIRHIKNKFKFRQELVTAPSLNILKGKKTSTNFPAASMDKIIIRNSIHHFSKMEAMLASIKMALKPDGMLLISEPFIELNESTDRCEHMKSRATIEMHLKNAGFTLLDEKEMYGSVLMKWKK